MTKTRQQATARLQEVQAQMFVLGEEAKQLAGYLNGATQEDREYYAMEKMEKEASQYAEMEAAAAAPSPNEESAEAENEAAESA